VPGFAAIELTLTAHAAKPIKPKKIAFFNIAISPRFASSPPLATLLPGEVDLTIEGLERSLVMDTSSLYAFLQYPIGLAYSTFSGLFAVP
jgi:hypothetical protein